MIDVDKWQEIYLSISKHKQRTLLTAFGVFWGIMMLVLLLGAGKGLENGVNSIFSNMAQNSMWFWVGKTTLSYQGMKPGRLIQFTNGDYVTLKKELPELKYISPEARLEGTYTINYIDKTSSSPIVGAYPHRNKIKALHFNEGRFINEYDIKLKRKVAVMGIRAVELLFGDENAVGKVIKINGVSFLVIGVFAQQDTDGKNENEKIYIPLTTLHQAFNMQDRISVFVISPKPGIDPVLTEKKVKSILCRRHKIDLNDKSAIGTYNSYHEVARIQGLFTGINMFIWIVGIGTIIAGIIGVSNIMLIVVKERTKEIGIRKALGAKPSSIIAMVIQESIVITSISGYTGLVCGVFLLEGVKNILSKSENSNPYFSNPEIDIRIAFIATAILVIAGALAGLVPARKASLIKPIEALRAD